MLGFRRVEEREVKLSRAGKLFIVFTLAIGFAAVNTGNNMLFLLVSMMLALMILSGFAALLNLQYLDVRLVPGQLLQMASTGELRLQVSNPRAWTVWLLELRLPTARAQIARLPGRATVELRLPWRPMQRGPLQLPELRLGSAFPFSFVWRGQRLVLPAEDLPWVAPATGGPGSGETVAAVTSVVRRERRSGGDAVAALRPRLPNEALSRVLWRRSDWRQGFLQPPGLPVLLREEERDPVLQLDYHDPALAALGHEERLQALHSALDRALQAGAAWCLRLPAGDWTGRGRAGYRDALWALARQAPFAPAPEPVQRRRWWRR